MPYTAGDSPTRYAIHSHTADTVTIEINCVPQTAFTLYADAHQVVADLSGSSEPAFPESFHDVIIEGVMADELRKLEKPQLAQMAQKEFDRILSDLKFWVAKENALDIYQGKTSSSSVRSGSGGSSSSAFDGSQSWTQTGLITFDRDPSAPFAVTASSAVVPNLDADKLDGFHETSFAKLADNETISGNWEFDGTVNFDGATDFDNTVDVGDGGLILPKAATPTPTAEGSIYWDTDNDLLVVGTGAISAMFGTWATTNTDTGTQNAWAPGVLATTLISWSGASDLTVNGIDDAGIKVGQILRIANTGSNIISFTHQSGSAAAGEKITTDGLTISIAAKGWIMLVKDNVVGSGNWVVVGWNQGAGISFTPTIGGSGGQSGQVYSSQTGTYVRTGKLVHFQVNVALSTLGTITSGVQVKGLPFTSAGTAARTGVSVGFWGPMTSNFTWIGGYVENSSTVINITGRTSAGTTSSFLAQADLSATTQLVLGGTYEIA
jgi:hypothetical protein